jgi:hypothetical protein
MGSRHFDQAAECEEWNWEAICGAKGSLLIETSENYVYARP